MEDISFNVEEQAPEYGKQPAYNIKHRAYSFSKELVLYIGALDIKKIHFSLFDQLTRSGTSIGANLVEGRSGSSVNDFLKFYTIALKSANETKYWLCLIRDTIATDKIKIGELLTEADELSKIIAKIIINTKS